MRTKMYLGFYAFFRAVSGLTWSCSGHSFDANGNYFASAARFKSFFREPYTLGECCRSPALLMGLKAHQFSNPAIRAMIEVRLLPAVSAPATWQSSLPLPDLPRSRLIHDRDERWSGRRILEGSRRPELEFMAARTRMLLLKPHESAVDHSEFPCRSYWVQLRLLSALQACCHKTPRLFRSRSP